MRSRLFTLAVLAAVSLPSLAHEGHGATASFAAGVIHPLLGIDHLLAMLAVGIWAVQIGTRAVWLVPLSFCLAISAGAGLGYYGITFLPVEPLIALSVLILGLLVSSSCRLPPLCAAPLVACFAMVHGMVHAMEQDTGATPIGYVGGMVFATMLLHLAGAAGATLVQRRVRATGVPLIAYGAWLLGRAFV